MRAQSEPTISSEEGAVVTKAVMRAAEYLHISNKNLSAIIGVSESSISRIGNKFYTVRPGEKSFELAILLIRLYRSLDTIVGGDHEAAREWLKTDNLALRDVPLEMIKSITGLNDVVAYLDSRRAVI